MDPTEIFEQKAKEANEKFIQLSKKHKAIATGRVVMFLASIVLLVLLANAREVWGVVAIIFIFPIPFGLLVKHHNKTAYDRDQAKYIKEINENELSIQKGNLRDLESGEEFIDKSHPYSYDLDVFGRNSLFQLTNRASTPSGKKILANWLQYPVQKKEVEERQEAVKELTADVDWRQNFQAAGMHEADAGQDVKALIKWLEEPPQVINNTMIKLIAWVLPLITLTLITLNIVSGLTIYPTLVSIAVNGWALKNYLVYIQDITAHTASNLSLLKSYGALIKMIEDSNYTSQQIVDLHHEFKHDDFKASETILSLQKKLDFLNGRANMFYLMINSVLLLDIHLLLAVEKWKKNNKANVSHWFEAIGKLEALCSLAGLSYASPKFNFPTVTEHKASVQFKNLGHPLILNQERVTNDFEMKESGSIALVTGSNMSGKSTFLRTVGVNIVLGLAGAPVCADSGEISFLQLFTGMRTEDNLEEHVSSFYAELKRIQTLLNMVKDDGTTILFMLDEILKGTNSKDRHKGAAALIRQLSKTNSFGFVSTHDLELGSLTEELQGVKNYSFNSRIENDEIIFEYKLEEGLCHSFNASKLMEKIGIDMEGIK